MTTPTPATPDSECGWAMPRGARRWHYFVDGAALCGQWAWLAGPGPLKPDAPEYRGHDDCRACTRALDS